MDVRRLDNGLMLKVSKINKYIIYNTKTINKINIYFKLLILLIIFHTISNYFCIISLIYYIIKLLVLNLF